MDDRDKIYAWLKEYCLGFRRARTRANILPFLRIQDRLFRAVVSTLKHEGLCASTSKIGYWAIPEQLTKEEVDAVLDSYKEMRAKALDMLTGLDNKIKHFEMEKLKITQGQGEFI